MWLRDFIFKDWWLKILSLALALFISLAFVASLVVMRMKARVFGVPAGVAAAYLGGLLVVAFVFMFLKQLIGVFEMSVLPLTFFGLLAFCAHLLALVTVTFEIWLQRRGPRLTLRTASNARFRSIPAPSAMTHCGRSRLVPTSSSSRGGRRSTPPTRR